MVRSRDKVATRRIAPRARATFRESDFFRALRAADHDRCRELAQGNSPRAILAASRLAIRERRFIDVIGRLSGIKTGSATGALERDVLLGTALGLTRDFVAGKSLLDRALTRLPKRSPLTDDAQYYRASIAWAEHDHRTAESIIAPQLESPDPNNRARTHVLLSWVALRRCQVEKQVSELEAALDELDVAPERDEFYRANALLTLALLGRELNLPESRARVRSIYDSMLWNNGIALHRFQVTRFLATYDALEGNELGAFGRLRTAMQQAPTDYWRVFCLLDRARLAKQTGERAFALDLLLEADELAMGLQWGTTEDEERAALLVAAELFSDVDPSVSQRYLALSRSLTSKVSALLVYGSDPRVRAFEAYSAGVTQLNLGDRAAAATLLLEAWSIFNDFHYGWRAALCALGLFEATREARWLERADRCISPWPRSWIARLIASTIAATRSRIELPAVQRQVLELLRSGKRNAEIAAILGRSPHTVRNHIAQLFKAYGVTTRAALVASSHDGAGKTP